MTWPFLRPFIYAALAYATLEMGFTEIVRRYAYPAVFIATPTLFTVLLLLSYVGCATVLAILVQLVATSLAPKSVANQYATGTLVSIVLVNVFIDYQRFLLPIAMTGVALLAIIVASAWSQTLRQRIGFLTSPWAVSALLLTPDWLANDFFLTEPYLPRAIAALSGLAVVTMLCFMLEGWFRSRRRVSILTSWAAVVVIVATTLLLRPPANRELPPLRRAPPRATPNVLLITLDTVRADHLSLYQYERDTTPQLKRLAARATLYKDAIAPSNYTLPSHASLFTGLYASEHGAHSKPLAEGIPTLAEIYRRRGYDVSGVAANYAFLGRDFGLDRGFSYLYYAPPARATASLDYFRPLPPLTRPVRRTHLLRYRQWRALMNVVPQFADLGQITRADEITRRSISRIDHARRVGRPFFLFVNYMDAHAPYLPPAPYDSKFPGKDASVEAELRRTKGSLEVWPTLTDRANLTPARRADLISRYDGGIAFVDAHVGLLLDAMRARGVFDNTIIVVTSDHGEAFAEHGTLTHGFSTYDEEVRVPLLIHLPGQDRSSVISQPVSVVDVFPFLVSTGTAVVSSSSAIVAEGFPLEGPPSKLRPHAGRALVSGDFKYIRLSGSAAEELYNRRLDAQETRNLIAIEPSVRDRLSKALDGWIETHPSRIGAVPTRPLPEETLRRLRALGYIH